MSSVKHSVALPAELVAKAAIACTASGRTVEQQIEYWAAIGIAISLSNEAENAVPISECIADVGTERGRERLRAYLASLPFPHFEAEPGNYFTRVDADGVRTRGKFIGRDFVTEQS